MSIWSTLENSGWVVSRFAPVVRMHLAICAALILTGCGASSDSSGGDHGSTLPPTMVPAVAPTATPPSPLPAVHIACTVATEVCMCSSGSRCGNESVAPGVKNRGDADSCCCQTNAPLIWEDKDAKCMETSKCTWGCCGSGQKLCGDVCCAPGEKCFDGTCQQVLGLLTVAFKGLLV